MSIFGTIMSKLGFGKKEEAPAVQEVAAAEVAAPVVDAAPVSVAISEVDVVGKLNALAANNSEKLNWQTSIVDLMKLLGMDSSLAHRKELATELGCPANLMDDSASMNMWLHKTVLQQLAANGGNIPASLLG
jgi:hypothetical protein